MMIENVLNLEEKNGQARDGAPARRRLSEPLAVA